MDPSEGDCLLPKPSNPPPPKDRCYAVFIIFYVLGIGSLLPWNFFSTARQYFVYKLRNTTLPEPASLTNDTDEYETNLQTMFESYLTVAAMVPNVLFMFLNTAATKSIPLKTRICTACVVMILMFSGTTVLSLVNTDNWQQTFFGITIGSIVVMNAASAVFQGGVFGLAGMFPKHYTGAVMGGMGMGGSIASITYITTIAVGSDPKETGFAYFLIATLAVAIAFIGFLLIPCFKFAGHHMEESVRIRTVTVNDSSDEDWPSRQSPSGYDETAVQTKQSQTPVLLVVFRQVWMNSFCVFFVFFITLSCYPAINSAILSQGQFHQKPGIWATKYFAPVSCFLVFNLTDLVGRTLAPWIQKPKENSCLLPLLCVLRTVFVPIFLLCNVHPRQHLPVVFHHDFIPIVAMALFGVSNGYLGTLGMMYGPRKVASENVETAGSMLAFFLSTGLACGSLFSLLLRTVI